MAECNLGKVKLEPMLTAAVRGGHVGGRGCAFTGFAAGAFGLHSSYVFVPCLPVLLAIVECLLAPTLPTLSCLHRVTFTHTVSM